MTIKLYKARFISQVGDKLGKRIKKWEVPADLRRINKGNKYRTLIGIGKWRNEKGGIYVCLSQGNENIFIGKKIWLEITKSLKELKSTAE